MILFLLGSALAGELTVDMLDVGQGDSLLLTTSNGQRILIDAGTSSSGVADTLMRMNVARLDLAVSTHPHADHIGGMAEVLERIPVEAYLDSGSTHTTRTYRKLQDTLRERGVPRKNAKAGQVFDLGDGATMRVIWPGTMRLEGTRSDLNSNSVVLRVENGEDCMLFTGDAEEDTEHAIVRHNFQPCGLLKVAHHGSRHSTSQSFLNAVSPQIALISSGEGNRYRHPGDETIRKLHRMDVQTFRTDLTGHVTIVSTGNGFRVEDGLPDGAPLRFEPANTLPETGPVTEETAVQPVIIDPRAPENTPSVEENRVEIVDKPVDAPQTEEVSSCKSFLQRLAFWR